MTSEQPLPPDWIKCFSKSQNRDYYYNTRTNVSVWKLEDLPTVEKVAAAVTLVVAKPPNEEETRKTATKVLSREELELENFKKSVRAKINAFMKQEASKEYRFDYCDKEYREAIKLLAHEEFSLVAETEENEDGDKIVVVFKPKTQEELLQIEKEKQLAAESSNNNNNSNSKKRKKNKNDDYVSGKGIQLLELGKTKRDRSTIEDFYMQNNNNNNNKN